MTSEADEGTATRRLDVLSDLLAELHAALADGDRALADGDLRASRPRFERAYQLAELAGDPAATALAALGLAGLWVSERRTVTDAVMLESRLQDVLPLLEQGSSLAVRIRARLAAEADYRRGTHAEILAALADVRACADPAPLAEALSLAHHCLLGPDDVTARRALAAELIKVSFRTGRRSDRLMGLLWQTVDGYAAGDPHAGRLLSELRDHLSQRDHRAVGFVASAIEVMLAIRAGRLEDAESLALACASSGAAAGDIDSEWWPGGQLVTIRWYQGRLVELLPMLTERVGSPALSAVDNSSVAALAVAAALNGDRRTAASCVAALRGTSLASLPKSSSWLVTMNGIAEAAYLLADAEPAAEVYELLSPYSRLPLVGGLGVTCFGSAHQALGIAALTGGQLDRAIDHLRAAVQGNLALAHWPALVSARQRLAHALTLRGRPADTEAAARELASAAGEAVALGLPGPVRRMAGAGQGAAAQCVRAGRKWRLTLRDRSVLVQDSVGMLHLAVLIANPRRDIPAAELVAGLAALSSAPGGGPYGGGPYSGGPYSGGPYDGADGDGAYADGGAGGAGGGGTCGDGGGAQPVLDQQAISAYRKRLAQLDAEAGLPAGPDPAGQAQARVLAEREWLTAQLASAAGLSGRTRAFPDTGERARIAAGKAIRRALGRIAEADPVIGEHLRETVRTGTRCSYWPG